MLKVDPIVEFKAPSPGTRRGRVCLIHPPTVTSSDAYGLDVVPPLGLAYIAASLRSCGHEVTVVDGAGEALQQYSRVPGYEGMLVHGLTFPEVIARIDPKADVIGVSNMFSNQWLFIRDMIENIKKRYPEKLVVMGGEHVTACAEFIIKTCAAVDVCVKGEGEATMVGIMDAYCAGRTFHEVGGVVFRDGDKIVETPKRARIKSIDEIPEPDWTLVPIERYIENACTYGANLGRSIPLLASRGCPFECTFCSNPQMWTTKWTVRKPELVMAEMQKYKERYGVTNFDFYDLTAIVKKQWIVEFCNLLIKNNMNITWQLPSGTRSEALDADIIPLLFKSGCRLLIYAPESGSPEELKRIKKKVNLDRMRESMRLAYKAGMETKANFIFGMVGATWKDVFNTFKFLFRIALAGLDNATAYPFSPYPGSEDFNTLVAQGKITVNDDYFRSLLLLSRNLHTKNTVSYTENFNAKTLSLLCSSAFIFFYSTSYIIRPVRIWRLLNSYFVKRESSSLLTMAFLNVRRKKAVLKMINTDSGDTVSVPEEVRLRNKEQPTVSV
jgi:radical SAM superfamily enzyme YgiQ (UPF0313 family)